MRDSGCGCAAVVEDTESLELVGVVTEHDVCCRVAADDRRPSEVLVEEIMQQPSACCEPDQSVDDARHQLHEHHAMSLPVMDAGGSCCGTVSAQDLEPTGA
jgi:CBS domain-containing protein